MLTVDRRVEAGDLNAHPSGISEHGRREMYETFQTWALKTYGDSGKTKTVTRKKYSRIVRILNGDEEATTENSKFRFWVKAKGFKLGKVTSPHSGLEYSVLHVPVKPLVSNHCNFLLTFFDLLFLKKNTLAACDCG